MITGIVFPVDGADRSNPMPASTESLVVLEGIDKNTNTSVGRHHPSRPDCLHSGKFSRPGWVEEFGAARPSRRIRRAYNEGRPALAWGQVLTAQFRQVPSPWRCPAEGIGLGRILGTVEKIRLFSKDLGTPKPPPTDWPGMRRGAVFPQKTKKGGA